MVSSSSNTKRSNPFRVQLIAGSKGHYQIGETLDLNQIKTVTIQRPLVQPSPTELAPLLFSRRLQ